MSWFDTRHAFKSNELFEHYNYKKIGINKKLCEEYGAHDGAILCGIIFTYFVYLIILDIVTNNVTFKVPYGFGVESFIQVRSRDKNYILKYPNYFLYLDPIASEWIGYQLTYEYPLYNGERRERILHIYGSIRKLFAEYINNGRKYF